MKSRPENPIAARIQSGMQERIRYIEDPLKRNNSTLRDSDVLGVLVFLQRLELQKNNRRAKKPRVHRFSAGVLSSGAAEGRGIEPDSAMTGIVVFAHGSTVESANDAVARSHCGSWRAGREIWSKRRFWIALRPKLADAVAALAAKGVSRIVVIPYFLTLGIHLQRDLPRIAEELRGIYQGVSIEITEPLDGHPASSWKS